MSTTYGSVSGFALILTSDQYMQLWNRLHEDDKIVDEFDLFALDDNIQDYSRDNALGVYMLTSSGHMNVAGWPNDFGKAIVDEDATGQLNIYEHNIWVTFAPKQEEYFKAPYANFDDMLQDIMLASHLFGEDPDKFEEGDIAFARDHTAYLSIATFG